MKPIYAILTAVLCLLSLRVDAQDNDPDNDVCSQFVGSMSLGSNSGNIISNGDVDYYQIDLQGPGVLHVTVNALLGAAFNVAVYPGTCGSTALASAPTGSLNLPNSVDALVCAGLYYVRIARQTGVAPLAYSFDAELNQDDQYECNNQLSEASPLLLNTTLQAQLYGINNTLLPVTTAQSSAADNCDRDFYSVQSTGCGVLRVAISNPPPTMRMNITVLDSTGAVVRDRQTAPNNGDPIDSEVLLFAGKYYILISEANQFVNYGSPILSQLPYTLTLSYDDTDQFECNNQLSEASPLLLNTTLQAQLYGINNTLPPVITAQGSAADNCDRDFYSVESPDCGVLRVAISNPPATLQMNITVLDSTGAVITDRVTALTDGAPVEVEALLYPGKSYILISEAGQFVNYGSPELSALPYTLTLEYDPTDQCECNNSASTACVIVADTVFNAKLRGVNVQYNPDQDVDFYEFSVGCDTLSIAVDSVPNTQRIKLTLFNGDGVTQNGTAPVSTIAGQTVNMQRIGLPPGTYYLRVSENANSMSSESYRLSIACGQLSTGTAVSDIGTSKPQFFPNPTSGALDVLLPASHTEGTLLQMDPAGRITHQQRFAAGAGRIALDLTDDQPGLYLLELRFADGTRAVERVMRQ